MSILSRLADGHLHDDALVEIWAASASDRSSATNAHLTSCAHCRTRYSVLAAWLEDVRLDAYAEADEAISPERLAAQQTQILRRLEALERPARIIAFPKASRPQMGSRRAIPRWVPTAAAAGLVIGLATGQIFQFNRSSPPPTIVSENAGGRGAVQPASFVADEALFYGDAEGGVRSSMQYLPALDELTPRARDEFDPR